jgi:hypothetical protein
MYHILTLIALLSVAGCVGHELHEPSVFDQRPVDMTYRVTVTRLSDEENCSLRFLFDSGDATVDFLMQADGKLTLRSDSAYLPFYSPITGMESRDGNIHQVMEPPPNQPDFMYRAEIDGTLTPDFVDMTLTVEEREHDQAEPCHRSVRIVGQPRALLDPDALDGRYLLKLSKLGMSCGEPLPPEGEPLGSVWADIDPYRPGKATFDFLTGSIVFDFSVPDETGAVDWSGVMFDFTPYAITELPGTLVGRLEPKHVDLLLGIGSNLWPVTCRRYFRLVGSKAVPTTDTRTGEYRARIRVRDGCSELGEFEYDDTVILVEQDDGKLWLYEGDGSAELTASGDAITADIPFMETGLSFRYSGRLDPPHLAYTSVYKDDRPGKTCQSRAEVTAIKRFIFPPQ